MKKGRGRPKITLVEVIIESMTLDRVDWRQIIHMADPN